ncbi:hypothetical protein [Simkania sp.]|uniref:hypothetical protein n=1 Tax=Simkania sp. TaxID=34094 RepID=UPI003B520FE5
MALRVDTTHSASATYADKTPTMNLGIQPGTISGTGRSLVGRTVTPYGISERTSNTTRMGDVMLKRGVNPAATMALLEKIGHQNGLIEPSTGMINYQAPTGESVTVKPILGQTARDQAKALAANEDRYPVAWIEVDGQTRLATFDTTTRQLKFENHSIHTLQMGRMMIENGADPEATRALAQAIGAKTDRFDQFTGAMTFDVRGSDVTVTPILTKADRNIAKVVTPNGSYPVATMTANGATKLLVYNTETEKIEKLTISHNLPANISDYRLHGQVPHMLTGVNAAMATNGVSLTLRSSVLAYLQEQGVSSVISDSTAGRFSVTLNTGETFSTGY